MKDCKDCRFSKRSFLVRRCHNPEVMVIDISRVFNELKYIQHPVYCSVARREKTMCGPNADFFVEKDPIPDEPERRN